MKLPKLKKVLIVRFHNDLPGLISCISTGAFYTTEKDSIYCVRFRNKFEKKNQILKKSTNIPG